MRIGFDIDNVISDFDAGILEAYFIEDKKKRNRGIVNPEGSWIKNQFDWSEEETESFFNENMERIAKKLKPREHCEYYMNLLMKEGHEIYLISHRAFPHYQAPYQTTVDWLKEYHIPYTQLILSKTTNKSEECRTCQVDIMFDDVLRNCLQLQEAKINCYMMGTDYDKEHHEGIPMVHNWKEIYDTIQIFDQKRKKNIK